MSSETHTPPPAVASAETDLLEKHQEVDLHDVMQYFAKGFNIPDDKELIGTTYWIDVVKKKVMYRLVMGKKNG